MAGAQLLVNCTRRFDGRFEAIRRLAETGELGRLIHMVGHCQGVKPFPEWVADTEGPLLHDAVHLFDIMRFFAGDAESLIGTARNPTKRFRFEDTSHAVIQFAHDVEGIAVVDEMAEYCEFALELNFTRGRIRLGSFAEGMWVSIPDENSERDWWQHLEPRPLPDPAWPGTGMLRAAGNLVQAVQDGAAIRCDVHDGRASVEIITAIYASQLQDGARIRLPLPDGPSPLEELQSGQLL